MKLYKNICFWVCMALGVLWFALFLQGNGLLLSTDEPHTTNFWMFLLALLCLLAIYLLSKRKLEKPLGVNTFVIMTVFVYVYHTFFYPAQ